ncbi:unnamed protein product [Caenorhabditis sp. 36 PRJEB53466]|nr:unnamed protein product [Caenorhabditis sp. 36 PRJEB53466]
MSVNSTTLALLNDHLTSVLATYGGRDKAIRSLAFYLQLRSTSAQEHSKEILALAKQLSSTRLVLRQFNHPGMFKACRQILQTLQSGKIGDPVEFLTGAAVTVIYTVYGLVELLAWLSDAKLLAYDSAKLYKWCLYLWLMALINGIVRQLRVIYRKGIEKSKEDVLTLVGLSSDFISGFNSLPYKVLWAGKLSLRQSASFSLLASIIGFYKLW